MCLHILEVDRTQNVGVEPNYEVNMDGSKPEQICEFLTEKFKHESEL